MKALAPATAGLDHEAVRLSGAGLPAGLLATLVAAPLALGSVHELAYVPLLGSAFVLGIASWTRARRTEAGGPPAQHLPGSRLLLALHLLVALQLVPLPPSVLRWISPGTFALHTETALVPQNAWRPVSVSPADTARGLVFLAAMSLMYAACMRELAAPLWRRRAARAVVATGVLMTLVALAQSAWGGRRIYGLYHPEHDWAVFGPYVNRNHFAGYLVMALPLALAFAIEAADELRQRWARRRPGWLALGEAAGSRALQTASAALALIVGVVASGSRGGLVAFVVSLAALALGVGRRRAQAIALAVGLAALALAFVDLDQALEGFETRGLRASRLELWADVLPLVPRFALLGCGFNAFATAYLPRQTVWRSLWIGEAHNEYLQALVELGLAGAAMVAALVTLLLRRASQRSRSSALATGLCASLLGACVHNLVEFNWQIPANAVTFAALAGLAMAAPRPNESPHIHETHEGGPRQR